MKNEIPLITAAIGAAIYVIGLMILLGYAVHSLWVQSYPASGGFEFLF